MPIDFYKTDSELILVATVAGIKSEDLDISIEGGIINIKGVRKKPENLPEEKESYFKECYWGPFSRQIVLPEEINPSQAEATLKSGILIIKIPYIKKDLTKKIEITS